MGCVEIRLTNMTRKLSYNRFQYYGTEDPKRVYGMHEPNPVISQLAATELDSSQMATAPVY
jgi:hypothetical protein